MIVSESDTLVAALDRRLTVDRVLALAPLDTIDAEAGADAAEVRGDDVPANVAPRVAALAPGAVVAARVVDVPTGDHVLVDIGRLRIALSWPAVNGPPPTPGRDVALRVVACAPTLLFETVVDEKPAPDGLAARPSLSADAMRLQHPSSPGDGPIRFTAPILAIASDAPPAREAAPATHAAVDAATIATNALPLVLQGPAWPGQDVELVVRRDRADDAFDNAALDQWCGEIVIELPAMGRVTGHLAWSLQGLRLRIEGEDEDRVRALSAASASLATALVDADLPVLALTVARPVASQTGGGRRG